jgi:hypothetical protein
MDSMRIAISKNGVPIRLTHKEGNDRFIITAFMTSKPDKILRRGTIWQK